MDNMLDDLEFERQMGELSDRGLMEFTARQVYETRKDVYVNRGRIIKLERRNRRVFAFTAGTGTIIGGAIITLYNYFTSR